MTIIVGGIYFCSLGLIFLSVLEYLLIIYEITIKFNYFIFYIVTD